MMVVQRNYEEAAEIQVFHCKLVGPVVIKGTRRGRVRLVVTHDSSSYQPEWRQMGTGAIPVLSSPLTLIARFIKGCGIW